MTHNRIGHRFQRRLDVPVWLERGPQGLAYADKVLGIEPASLIAYWPLWEDAGLVADNLEGTAARDGTYDPDVTLGALGIGDGRTAVRFDLSANEFVNIDTASFRAAFDGDTGTAAGWIANDGSWNDAQNRRPLMISEAGFANRIMFQKDAPNGQFSITRQGGGVTDVVTVVGLAPEGNRYIHWAITWSLADDEVKAYQDGVQVGVTQNGLAAWNAGPNLGTIGAGNVVGGQQFDGRAAHVPIWTSVLSDPQILSLATV